MNDILKNFEKIIKYGKIIGNNERKENPCEICLINCFLADFWQVLGHDLDP